VSLRATLPRRALQAGRWVLIALVLGIFLLPIYTMLVMSFKAPAHVVDLPLLPFSDLTLDNYRTVLLGEDLPGGGGVTSSGISFVNALRNSIIVSFASTTITLLAGVPAAYVLARHRFRWRRGIAFFILATRFAPPLAIVLPFYTIFSRVGLLDTHAALVTVYVAMNLSIVIWMMMGFFRDVPREIEDAARVDGCGSFGVVRHVTLPLASPGITATAIFVTFLSWNEFLMALVLTNSDAVTGPLAALSYIRNHYVAWGPLTAAGALVAVPILIFALIIQRRLVGGMTAGAVRG
jgi:multiple sugar transport system permease protein